MRRTRWSDLSTAFSAGAGGSKAAGGATADWLGEFMLHHAMADGPPYRSELTSNQFIEIIVDESGGWRQGEAAGISGSRGTAPECGSLCCNDGKEAV